MKKTKFFVLLMITLFTIISSQTCGVKNPTSFDDCKYDSSKNSICCFAGVSLLDKEETLCVYVPKSQVFITPFITSMDIGLSPNNIKMDIDCGFKAGDIPQNESYSICGENPTKVEDCFIKSTLNQSCCYVRNPDESTVCLLNSGIYKGNNTYFGIQVVCSSETIKKSIVMYMVLLMILFI